MPFVPITQSNLSAFARLNGSRPRLTESVHVQVSRHTPLASNATEDDIHRITVNNRKFVLEDAMTIKRGKLKRKRTSPIHKHGRVLLEVVNGKITKEPWWLCTRCDLKNKTVLYNGKATSSPALHLTKEHGIHDANGPAQPPPALRPVNVPTVTADHFNTLVLGVIVNTDLPLNAMNNPAFRAFVEFLNPNLMPLLPRDHGHGRRLLIDSYNLRLESLKAELRNAKSKIHLSWDLWTSPNHKAILGIVGHFVNQQWVQQTRLLGLKEVYGSHSGNNQAVYIIQLIRELELQNKFGFFIGDNATTNDTGVSAILHEFYPLPHVRRNVEHPEVERLRARCFNHIMNLICKDGFLGGTKFMEPRPIEESITVSQAPPPPAPREVPETPEEEAKRKIEEWRKLGPLGLLHYLIVYIRASPQRIQLLARLAKQFGLSDDAVAEGFNDSVGLILDNSTRWNSTFVAAKRALELKDVIELFYCENSSLPKDQRIADENRLRSDDWAVISQIVDILGDFHALTMKFEGNSQSIFYVNSSVAYLEEKLEERYRQFHECLSENAVTAAELDQVAAQPVDVLPASQDRPHRQRRAPRRFAADVPAPTPTPAAVEPTTPASFDHQKFLRLCCGNALIKLRSYRETLLETPIYRFASVLHPGIKDCHTNDGLDITKALINKYLADHYPPLPANRHGGDDSDNDDDHAFETTPRERRRQEEVQRHEQQRWAALDPLDEFIRGRRGLEGEAIAVLNELEIYLQMPIEQNLVVGGQGKGTVIDWWRLHAERFPRLSRMAVDILSVPASSSECERVFSLSKLVITSQRHRMTAETLQAIVCLKAWTRQGLYNWGLIREPAASQ